MLAELRQDAERLRGANRRGSSWFVLEALLFDNGFQAVVLYRLAHWVRSQGIPFFGPLIARYALFLTGVDINPAATIGPGLRISHGVGIVIGGAARVGAGALLLHQVTLGSPSEGRVDSMPVVGDNVFIGAGAKLIGAIRIGDDVVIGPNAVVTCDVPSNSRVLSTAEITITPRGA